MTNNLIAPDIYEKFMVMVSKMNEMKQSSYNPGDQSVLYMYSRYKQAMNGNVSGSRPNGFLHPINRKKWDAWNELRGMSSQQAMVEYIQYGTRL
jgi:acyl-CoA-binding protein